MSEPPRRSRRTASCYTVSYGREGWRDGSMFVERNDRGQLELTTPVQIIRMHKTDVLELWAELARLFGFQHQAPSAGA